MYINTLEVTLTKRTSADVCNVNVNQGTLAVLSLVFEFKILTAWQLARFLDQRDESKSLYLKLRNMWKAQLLESFKAHSGDRPGMPVYYMLSKKGIVILAEQGVYDKQHLSNYPEATTLLSSGLFKHEAYVVELASMEAKHTSEKISITFKGELASASHDQRSDKNIEVFTPDYTATYSISGQSRPVYTEFERTPKSKDAMNRKLERYLRYLSREQRMGSTLRFIFQTPSMEQSFWLNIFENNPSVLQRLNLVTTNVSLLQSYEQFFEAVYSSERTIKLTKPGRLAVDLSTRSKLFPFL